MVGLWRSTLGSEHCRAEMTIVGLALSILYRVGCRLLCRVVPVSSSRLISQLTGATCCHAARYGGCLRGIGCTHASRTLKL